MIWSWYYSKNRLRWYGACVAKRRHWL